MEEAIAEAEAEMTGDGFDLKAFEAEELRAQIVEGVKAAGFDVTNGAWRVCHGRLREPSIHACDVDQVACTPTQRGLGLRRRRRYVCIGST